MTPEPRQLSINPYVPNQSHNRSPEPSYLVTTTPTEEEKQEEQPHSNGFHAKKPGGVLANGPLDTEYRVQAQGFKP